MKLEKMIIIVVEMEAKKHQTAIIGRYTERRGEGSRFEDRIFRT